MRWIIALVAAISFTACQQPQPRPDIKPAYFNDAEAALASLAKNVHLQLGGLKLPTTTVPVDDFFNETSAEVSTSAKAFQKQLTELLSQEPSKLVFAQLNRKNIDAAQWIVLASYTSVEEGKAEQPGKWVRLKVSVADVLSGERVAAAENYLKISAFQSEPTRFFKEAPLYLNDQRHKERVQAVNGQAAPLKLRLTTQAIFAEAVTAYEAGRFTEAESGFAEVVKSIPDHRGALTGIYQSLWQQGKKSNAEGAFANLIAQTAGESSLPFKILFRVNGTDFVDQGDLPQQYRLWTKSMGQVLVAQSRCLDVTGHASRSGSPEYNSRLSLQRAQRIALQIQQQTPGLGSKVKAHGKGFEEAIIGSGANDATDAIDRRVEFLLRACA